MIRCQSRPMWDNPGQTGWDFLPSVTCGGLLPALSLIFDLLASLRECRIPVEKKYLDTSGCRMVNYRYPTWRRVQVKLFTFLPH